MIQAIATKFADARLFVPDVFTDTRGYFKETWARRKYEELGIDDEWLQDAVSRSRKNVLRGMHYDMRMAKLAQVLEGRAFDVIVDVREGSPTYKQWQGFELSGDNHMQLYVPKGFAHGFLALSDEVIFHYKMSAHFEAAHERTLSWKDPSVGIQWPLAGAPILSPKDAAA